MSSLLVVGAGPPTRDGGVDLFLELMVALSDRGPARYMWLGGRPKSVARRLDTEIELLGMGADITWRPRGDVPPATSLVHVITARSAKAAQESLAEVLPGVPSIGLGSDPETIELLRAGDAQVVAYPDIVGLAERVLEIGRS